METEQRGHEPAAVLVAALGVEVGGAVRDVGVEVHDGVGAGAGLEPDVEDVHLFAELGVAAGAGGSGREDLFGGAGVPGVGGLFHEEVDDEFVDGGIFQRLGALAAEEDGDGDAPGALAADAPVWARLPACPCDALLAPGRNPGSTLLDLGEGRWRSWSGAGAGMGVSMAMNHCSVARKITALLQRQQCG